MAEILDCFADGRLDAGSAPRKAQLAHHLVHQLVIRAQLPVGVYPTDECGQFASVIVCDGVPVRNGGVRTALAVSGEAIALCRSTWPPRSAPAARAICTSPWNFLPAGVAVSSRPANWPIAARAWLNSALAASSVHRKTPSAIPF